VCLTKSCERYTYLQAMDCDQRDPITWSREDAKTLLDSIPKDSVSGLRGSGAHRRDVFYSFARVSAVLKLKVDDYYHNGARRLLTATTPGLQFGSRLRRRVTMQIRMRSVKINPHFSGFLSIF
jgi:hypothetical protein